MGEKLEPSGERDIPSNRQERIDELVRLRRLEIRLPLIDTKELTPEEEQALRDWMNSLSDDELTEQIRKRNEELNEEFRRQRPRGLTRP